MNRVSLTDAEFATVASLLHDAAGLTFDESRRDSLSFCIAERMRTTSEPGRPSYLDAARRPGRRRPSGRRCSTR